MKRSKKASLMVRAVAPALLLGATLASTTQAGTYLSTIGKFDFTYVIAGDDPRVKPLQVFDDGERTYFQFRADAPVPAIFAGSGQSILTPYREGPYIVVAARPREFVLAMGHARATAVHVDVASGAQPRLEWARAPGVAVNAVGRFAQPVRYDAGDATASSFATPTRGDVVEWQEQGRTQDQPVLFSEGSATLSKAAREGIDGLAKRIGADAKITVIGREDPSQKDGLAEARAIALRNALAAAGVPKDSIRLQIGVETGDPVKAGKKSLYASSVRWSETRALRDIVVERAPSLSAAVAKAVPATQKFEIREADADLAVSIKRWAKDAGYEVVWEAGSVPVTGASAVDAGDMLDAVSKVVKGLQGMGYPVKAQCYTDRVIRITKG